MTTPKIDPGSPFRPPGALASGAALRPGVTTGQRLAGALLLVNVALVVAEAAIAPQPPAAGIPMALTPLSAILDLVVGASLLGGSRTLVLLAIVRVAIGLVIHTALRITSDPVSAGMQVLVSVSLLLLLLGDAKRPRLALGAAAFAVYLLAGVAGIAAAITGTYPLGAVLLSLTGDIERSSVREVTGEAVRYRLTAPEGRWHLRRAEAARKDNPLADRWIVRPDKDAHVLVVAEHAPGKIFPLDAYTEEALAGPRRVASRLDVLGHEPMRGFPEEGRLVRVSAVIDGMETEYLYGLVTAYDRAFQIVAFAQKRAFAEVEGELREIVESFELPPEARQITLPDDVEPAPAGQVAGVAYGYTIRAPGDAWHLRKAEAARKDSEIADRWLVRPDKDAHVLVIAEHVQGALIPIDAFTDSVLEGAKRASTELSVLEREPLRSDPERGRFVHTTSTIDGMPVEHYYGMITAGDRAFQVVAWAHRDIFPTVQAELRGIIESFALPAAR